MAEAASVLLGAGSGAERQSELSPKGNCASGRGRPWSQTMFHHEPPYCVGCGGSLEPAHGSATAVACVKVLGEDVFQQPRPSAAGRTRLGAVGPRMRSTGCSHGGIGADLSVHRRHLLALSHVERLMPTTSGAYVAVVTAGGGEVPISRQAARRLRRQLDIA